MAWTEQQQLALAMVPKVSSLLSLAGSGWIMVEVWTEPGGTAGGSHGAVGGRIRKRHHPYHRLLFAMSAYDALESVWNFMSSWPIPRDTEGVWHPRGNTVTCSFQGFFLTLSVAVPIYNAFLSLYYVLVINYGYSDNVLRRRVEPAMHLISFVWAFGTALASVLMGLINNANLWCWIAPYPGGCLDSWRYGAEGNCERGDNAWIYRWAFYFAPLWGCIFFATICTILVYCKVRRFDQRTLQYRRIQRMSFMGSHETKLRTDSNNKADSVRSSSVAFQRAEHTAAGKLSVSGHELRDEEDELSQRSSTTSDQGEHRLQKNSSLRRVVRQWKSRRQEFRENNPRTMEVFQQAVCYMIVFYLTHVWSTSNRIMQQIHNGKTVFGLILVHSFFDPLQGFLNYFVYQRPRYLRLRKDRPELGRLGAAKLALSWTIKTDRNQRVRSTITAKPEHAPTTTPAATTNATTVSKLSKQDSANCKVDDCEISRQISVIEEGAHEDQSSSNLAPEGCT